jgi:2-dehydropantoate 2-reductase
MKDSGVIYIVGSGAVGTALAVCLVSEGRRVVAVRTRKAADSRGVVEVGMRDGRDRLEASIETIGLSALREVNGIIVITAKAQANAMIARELKSRGASGPIVVMQNGVQVETPFIEAGFREVYRCVLYLTSQALSEKEISFHSIKPSAIGTIAGDGNDLERVAGILGTRRFPLKAEGMIQREIWKKAVINAAFNSICALLETDNGVFVRSEAARQLAGEIVAECVELTDRLGLGVTKEELMDQVLQVSSGSQGQLISTLQDIRNGRETEIEYLNIAIARVGAAQDPPIALTKTALLGRMTLCKAQQNAESTAVRP